MGKISEDFGPFRSPGGLQGSCASLPVASAVAMPAPTALITAVSGTAAVATIAIPYPGFTGVIYLIPLAAFTGVTSGVADGVNFPIGATFTAVVGKVMTLVFDGFKWYANI